MPRRFILFFVIALICQCETALVTPRADSAAWLFMGQRQAFGEMPGRDLWDNKLPLIYLIGRLAMFTGHPQVFLWLVEAALTAVGALAVAFMVDLGTQNEFKPTRPATMAGALLCIASGIASYHAGGFMTECYAMPLSALAVLCTFLAVRSPASNHCAIFAVLSGLTWTLAVSFRLPLGLAAVGVWGVLLTQIKSVRHQFIFTGGHAFGVLAAVAVVTIHPLMSGYLEDCIDAAILWPLGIGHDRIPGPFTPKTTERLADWTQDILKHGWLHAAAIWGILVARRNCSSGISRLVTVWYVTAILSAAWGWASYAHYQYVALAPICLATGLLFKSSVASNRRHLAPAVIAITSMVTSFQAGKEIHRELLALSDTDRIHSFRWINTKAASTDSVLLWAWGRNADLLCQLNRPPGVRHFMAHAYLDMDLALFNEFVAEFMNTPPEWVFEDTRRDEPPLTRDSDQQNTPRIESVAALQQFIADRYTNEAAFGPWVIHRLHPPATQPSTP